MDDHLIQKAKEIIKQIIYISLATVNKESQPWSTPVYAAYDNNYNFYWKSGEHAEHSKNIKANSKVFISICDTTVTFGKGQGVFIQATADELINEADIEKALSYL